MPMAPGLRSLVRIALLSAVFAVAVFAQSISGVIAQGTITVTRRGAVEHGAITVDVGGESYCKVTITLGPPILRRTYTAVMNGGRVAITAPEVIAEALPLPVAPEVGCALVPQGIAFDKLSAAASAGEAVSVATDGSGRPSQLQWSDHGHAAVMSYGGYETSGGELLASSLAITRDGKPAASLELDSITAQVFAASDFPMPPLPARAAQKAGGAQ